MSIDPVPTNSAGQPSMASSAANRPGSKKSTHGESLNKSHDLLTSKARLIRRWAKLWQIPHMADQVSCEWSMRLTRSIGLAYPQRRLIRLHPLLQLPPNQHLLEEVLCHEAAHLAVFALYGPHAARHGPEWRQLLTRAGFQPRRGLLLGPESAPPTPRLRYIHTCPVCQATRFARRPQTRWRCVACQRVGLAGKLVVRSYPVAEEYPHA